MGDPENFNFNDFWILGLVGTLIHGFEYTKIFDTYSISSNNSLINRLLMVNGLWLGGWVGERRPRGPGQAPLSHEP